MIRPLHDGLCQQVNRVTLRGAFRAIRDTLGVDPTME